MDLEAVLVNIAEDAARMNTHYEVLKYMKLLTSQLGMNAFMVMTLPTVDILDISDAKIITNWPAEMLEFYDSNNLLVDSPIIRRMLTSVIPFNYDVDETNLDRAAEKKLKVIELFKRFDMGKGAYFPVQEASGGRGAVFILRIAEF